MSDFHGRVREMKMLQEAWAAPASGMIPVYGRRRVGKSELILHFLKSHSGLYCLGKQSPGRTQMQDLLRTAAEMLRLPLLAELNPTDWKAALSAVVSQWRQLRPGQKLVLALDEYQWMDESSRELPSVLQGLWDTDWRRKGDVLLILCGSYLGFMEREVLGNRSPLFGRRTGQIHLKPFPYHEAAAFHPRHSLADKARIYFICGGVPMYLKLFDDGCSVRTNIERNLLSEFGVLQREPDFLLREELRDVQGYYAILMACAGGARTYREIAQASTLPERSLPYYLQQLTELGYVSKQAPLTAGKRPGKVVSFAVEDPLLRFWFRFVFPNTTPLAQAGPQRVFAELVGPQLESYFGSGFERLCREAMPLLYAREGVEASFEVGQYWSKEVQLDLVSMRSDGVIDLGECKWGPASPAAVAEELVGKVPHYPNPRARTIGLRVFTASAPSKPRAVSPNVRWHTLKDLYPAQ